MTAALDLMARHGVIGTVVYVGSPLPAARSLAIVLHGVGSTAAAMRPLAEALAAADDRRCVLVPDAPEPFDAGPDGRQWFSIRGVTDANRAARVAAALPGLLDWIEAARQAADLPPSAVTLAGFSQGAIMALAAAARGYRCGHVIAIAGRLVPPVTRAGAGSPRITLLHGEDDRVIPAAEAAFTLCQLTAAGFDVAAHAFPNTGHTVSPAMLERLQLAFAAG